MNPTLVAVAHGTRDPAGPRVVEAVVARVRARVPEVPVRAAYVELNSPVLGEVVAGLDGPAVVVPLLLSTGHHVRHDLPGAAGRHPVAGTLGPDPLLTGLLQLRLLGAGVRPGQPVVLLAAGSSDPLALGDTAEAARLLGQRWGGPVRAAHLSGRGPRLPEVVASLRAQGHPQPAVASYLLAPGLFHLRAREQARALGLGPVTEVLGDHPFLAELVVRRYRAAAAAAPTRSSIPTSVADTRASRSSGSMWPAPGATVRSAPGIAAAS